MLERHDGGSVKRGLDLPERLASHPRTPLKIPVAVALSLALSGCNRGGAASVDDAAISGEASFDVGAKDPWGDLHWADEDASVPTDVPTVDVASPDDAPSVDASSPAVPVGGACGDGLACAEGARCACRAERACACTVTCGAGLAPCPAGTDCTTTPLGALCLAAPPPPPFDAGVTPAPDVRFTVDLPIAPPEPRVPTCIPTASTGEGGGRCEGLAQAWSARGINVGYYAFRANREVLQLSGDFDGDVTEVFARGATAAGVVLQRVPAGAYIGLSSVGPNYNPPTGCQVDTCGNPSRHACSEDSPPLRAPAGNGVFYWGYAYNGASHMQGWFLVSPGSLTYVGDDGAHPCALGPAGADFEVRSACGRATRCRGTNPSCGAVNTCEEGNDDCGRASCGARAGGALTPSAWRRTVTAPSQTHACTMREPPHASVRCLENGRERDFFFVYPFGAYLYWAQNSTTKAWLHYGDRVQVYFHNRDAQGVLWDFVEVLSSGAPALTPPSDGRGAAVPCSDTNPGACAPCRNGGTCGWVQDVFLR